MTIGLIWAQARGGVIGRQGVMPWHVPEDSRHFRAITGSGAVIMGRRTWDSLPARYRPLPGRSNIVVTRDTSWCAVGATVAHSIDEAIEAADSDVWIIGGGQLYAATIGIADVLEVTEIDAVFDGDTHAPLVALDWTIRTTDPAEGWRSSTTGLPYRFLRYER
ncbi:dihydrofolate reductase [Rathayibacter soli]|uniref:dihydrofolate reductase n=1 Tax=Rathayibacter soli TaxID=3144168 RepID=UPI0027E503E0|nr:dihydrofolate reductase [Glaciibacter superstes]